MAKKSVLSSAAVADDRRDDPTYDAVLRAVRESFTTSIVSGSKLFRTDAAGLFDLYLNSLPKELRQHHNCSACRRFVDAYGGLVTVSVKGSLIPIMWSEAVESPYAKASESLHRRVAGSRILSPFLAIKGEWGTPSNFDAKTGHTWHHLAVTAPAEILYRPGAFTAGQAMAAKRENFATVARALAEMPSAALDEALRMFEGEHLHRAEHFVGPVKWLRKLQDRPRGRAGENLLWAAVADAPEGYCHPRSSVVWPLLEEIIAGSPYDIIKSKFEAMVHPLRYQRPQAAPAAATIKQAEELFANLRLAPALERRFARMEDMQVFEWRPVATETEAAPSGGIFAHLKPKGAPGTIKPVELPGKTITWKRFLAECLIGVDRLQLYIPAHGHFTAFTAAVHADAVPLLKWDREGARNTVAWYTYAHGSPASQWNLQPGAWVDVSSVLPFPTAWSDKSAAHLGEGFLLSVAGCVDSRTDTGNALFPECLRAELHGVRSVIESYSRSAELSGRDETAVCGLAMRKGLATTELRTLRGGRWDTFRVDRWE